MLWRRATAFLQGFLVVKAEGAGIEKFINLVIRKGIGLWDLERFTPKVLVFRIRAKDFSRIRPFLRKTECRGRLLRRFGLPFLWKKFAKRRGWLLGMALFFTVLYLLSSFIWFIGVEGADLIDRSRIEKELIELGLYPGVGRRRIIERRDWIIRELKIKFPEAVWVSVKVKGVVALVSVVEKTLPPAREEGASRDLIAAKDGLITEMVVINGTPLVKEGDTVSKGDILILGEKVVRLPDGRVESQPIAAMAIVRARVWYEAKIEVPLVVWRFEKTAESRTQFLLRINQRLIPLFAWGKVTGNSWLSRRRLEIYRGRNQLSLVEFIKDTYLQGNWRQRQVPLESALKEARTEGEKMMISLLPPGIQQERFYEEWEEDGGLLIYRLTIETLEEIAEDHQKEEKDKA